MPRKRSTGDGDASSSPIANHERLVAMGQSVDRQGASPKRTARPKKRRWLRRTLIALGVVAVLVVGAVIADYYYLGSLDTKITVHNLQQSSAASENILLIGSTTRCGLAQQNQAYGLCSQGVTGVNSDIVMILHLDPNTHSVSLLSIPRDTFVPNARVIGANKIDAALYEGPSQLTKAIEEDFGVPINNFVELNFDTFANVVNALGGIKMYFPVPIFDAESGLNIERTGCYNLDGYHALQVVRARHLQIQPDPANHDPRSWTYEALSDLARIRRTHEFLRVLSAKVAARGLTNPLTDQGIARAVLPSLTVDSGFTENKMISLAETFAHTSIANVPQYTYPISDVETGSLLYQGYYYGDVVFPVEPDGERAIDTIFGVSANKDTFTGAALPAPSSVKVTVENGSGVANQAASISTPLSARGFDVLSTGNVTPDGPVSETVVWYGGAPPPANGDWSSPDLAAAESVLEQLQGPAVLGYDPSEVSAGAQVTIQTGSALTVAPAPSTTTTTTVHHAATTTTTAETTTTTTAPTNYTPPGMRNNPDFTTPSADNPTLEPWDPRACNAAGTGPSNTP
ncbi:MAG TPA: LCP family protein [Acidimicrobiales bacterium]